MYQMIKSIQNKIIINFFISLFLIVLTMLTDFDVIILVILFINSAFMLYSVSKESRLLKNSISNSRDLLPTSVNEAIELDKYCLVMFDPKSRLVIWQNEYFTKSFGSLLNENIDNIFDGFLTRITTEEHLAYNNHYYHVILNDESIIFKDVTLLVETKANYENEKDCILFIKIDSIDDISASLDEISYQNIIQKVRSIISDYAKNYDTILRRYKNDSYIVVLKQKDFPLMLKEGVEVLEKVKAETKADKITLSIGCALGFEQLTHTEFQAGKALDMALARGGDQIVVKEKDLDYKFYGGNSEAIEKRNRVKVRMIASSLETLIIQASNVVIMPHRMADLDALGASLGIAKFVGIIKKTL